MAWATSRAIRLSDLSAAETIDGGFARSLVELVEREPHLQLFQYEFVLEARRRPDLRDEAVRVDEFRPGIDGLGELADVAEVAQRLDTTRCGTRPNGDQCA
ncbi:MAG: hypothetical protein ABWX89_10160 [Paeniglutamicibacter terrestris]